MTPDSKELERLNKKLNKIGEGLINKHKDLTDFVETVLLRYGAEMRNDILRSFRNTPKIGEHYRRGKGRVHIASSPGNPPAIDRGELARSINFNVSNLTLELGSVGGAPYSIFLEEGTEKMEPRPFLAPVVERNEDNLLKDIGLEVYKTIQNSFKDLKGA